MYEQISNERFEEVIEQWNGIVWVKVFSDTVNVDVLYEDFEFLEFVDGSYQFGNREYNEENEYKDIIINMCDIDSIHIDSVSLDQIVLTMIDGIILVLEK